MFALELLNQREDVAEIQGGGFGWTDRFKVALVKKLGDDLETIQISHGGGGGW